VSGKLPSRPNLEYLPRPRGRRDLPTLPPTRAADGYSAAGSGIDPAAPVRGVLPVVRDQDEDPDRSVLSLRSVGYLPMQKVEKMRFRISSAVVTPVMASIGCRAQ